MRIWLEISKYKNITFHKDSGKWLARITHKKELVYYKYFDDEYEAHCAVEAKRKELQLIKKKESMK